MKKCLALLLVLLSLLSAASAEAPARANNAAVQAMLEATLANGAGIRKDPLAMLENAWRNGFDYFEVSYREKNIKSLRSKWPSRASNLPSAPS